MIGTATADGVRDTDERFVHDIDTLVDQLLGEKQIRHDRLTGGDRDGWLTQVRDRVLSHPALASSR
jgi:hypothetical protein